MSLSLANIAHAPDLTFKVHKLIYSLIPLYASKGFPKEVIPFITLNPVTLPMLSLRALINITSSDLTIFILTPMVSLIWFALGFRTLYNYIRTR